jgi:hypothetical protein
MVGPESLLLRIKEQPNKGDYHPGNAIRINVY